MRGISLENVSVGFGGVKALSDASLGVETGERLAVIGASGAGKSTLFRDEVELTGLLFDVVVVARLDLLVILGAEQVQELGVLYAEERVG